MNIVRRLAAATIATALLAVPSLAQSSPVKLGDPAPHPANLDFEEGEVGKAPPGWAATTASAGFPVVVTEENPKTGKRSAVLRPDKPTSQVGILMQSVDATPYRGHRIRYRAALRAENAPARLWLRVDRAGGQMGAFDNMMNRPVESSSWQTTEITADVDDDALTINFGLLHYSTEGATWIDDAAIVDVGKLVVVTEPARPLTARGAENLAAFARLFGYVRHFHPSDEAAATDWDVFAVAGVRQVEGAATTEELAGRLNAIFSPVAPTVHVVTRGTKINRPNSQPPPGGSVVEWRHKGFGTGNSVYSSERMRAPMAGPGVPDGFHDPRHPLTVELPGGVTAYVPLALFADAAGATVPRAAARPPAAPPLEMYTGNDRAARLAGVTIAWNVFRHFYPYFDVVKTDWPATLAPALAAAASDQGQEAYLRTLRRMVAALHDGHGGVRGPGQNQSAAIPVAWDWVEGQLAILRAADEGGEGLKAGDVVEKIDGRPAREAFDALVAITSTATPGWARYRATNELRSGPEGSTVTLEVRTTAGERRTLRLTRKMVFIGFTTARPAIIAEVRPGIFYVDIDRITDDDFKAALPKLAAARGIVFDLRGYPSGLSPALLGHLSSTPLESARWNVPIITSPDWTDTVTWNTDGRWKLEPAAPRLTAKIAFVTDGSAISYAESWMGIVEAYKLAEIVGEPTAGTNGNVNPFTLPGGYTISWTGMKVLKHDGTPHHGVGIHPTVPVSRTLRGVAEGRDEQLERAIAVVGG
jgi:C-terminal processing protease CtpA/Prc